MRGCVTSHTIRTWVNPATPQPHQHQHTQEEEHSVSHAIHPSGHNIQHAPERVELTEAETVPAKALRSTAAADARVASFMVDVMVWSCLLCSENKIMILKK